MAYGYWQSGLWDKEAVFHLFFRRPPFQGGFTIACGLEGVVDYIRNFHFTKSDIDYLSTLKTEKGGPYFAPSFLKMLSQLKLNISLDAMPEGGVVFPYEPLLRVQGPLMHCQLLESPLLNLINFPTLIATKAARVCHAAAGDAVLEFGLRRAQGIDGAITASRSAYVGGTSATSNVLAGKLFGIPVQGTQAHSWVMAFDDEEESFLAFAKVLPDNCVFLVDTYDTIEGVKKAIRVGQWLKEQGKNLLAIRLDSGDLAHLSIESRRLLDGAGFHETKIIASNELDETLISELKRQGSKVAIWGVGTNLVTAKDCSALDGVYKLSAILDDQKKWKYTMKLSEQLAKISNPGLQQVRRFFKNGKAVGDVIWDLELGIEKANTAIDPFDPTKQFKYNGSFETEDLLKPIFRKGSLVYKLPTLQQIREYRERSLAAFPVGIKRFLNPHTYPVALQEKLYEMKTSLVKTIRQSKKL